MFGKRFWVLPALLLVLGLIAMSACTQQAAPAPAPTAPATQSPAPTTAAPKPTATAAPLTLRGETTMPQNHDVTRGLVKRLVEAEKRSNGRLKFDISYGGALADARTVIDAVKSGALDWSHGSYSWVTGKDPIFDVANLPFAFNSVAEEISFLHKTPVGDLLEKHLNQFNIKGIGYYNSGDNVLHTTKKQVKTLEDVKGLKLRGPGGASTDAIKLLGGVPVDVISSEAYPSLEKGILDGAFFGYYTLESYKLIELVKYTNEIHLMSAIANSMFVNMDTWKKIPPDLQKVIADTFLDMEPEADQFWKDSATKYKAMGVNAGIQVTTPDDKEIARWRAVAGVPVWETIAKRVGSPDGDILLKALKDWHKIQ